METIIRDCAGMTGRDSSIDMAAAVAGQPKWQELPRA